MSKRNKHTPPADRDSAGLSAAAAPFQGDAAAAHTQDAPPESEDGPPGDPAGRTPEISVIGPARGRRRIGRQFGAEPVQIALADLSAVELAALRDDPELKVFHIGAGGQQ